MLYLQITLKIAPANRPAAAGTDLPKRLRDLRKRHGIVAYCRGPYCVMSLDAVDLLRRKGFSAQRLEHGVAEWRAQGWRVDSGEDRRVAGRP